jgi:hypothetical protein
MSLRAAKADLGAVEDGSTTRVGPIAVRTDHPTVDGFQRASGGMLPPGIVPGIFPIRWLALPEVRARLLEMASGDVVPVHEQQRFTYERRLELDRDYRLAVEITRTSEPERLTLHATVTTPDGDLCVQFETVLRLVGLQQGAIGVLGPDGGEREGRTAGETSSVGARRRF